ncbi:ABC transporter ATP-binding protein [Haladaptatus sp. DYF46]|uniref:ABC transporter ATP-binding protein n=1 Tax=Haladaptatus sp. DYF46 TaxID=2886041 RepID=UPI001E591711|nr:ABC transporter ATP-binding protein [Haladaptatus sp. DYF46]
MTAIDLSDVTKRFGDFTALDGLDLSIEDGEIFGFLGPNGAGKSTAINILLDFIRPTTGQANVLGYDAQMDSLAIRQRIGVLPDAFSVYDRLTGRQHLEFAIESKNAEDSPIEILERVGIADAADRKAGGYSKGMAQRLALGMALVDQPDLIILDEPSTGLDPNGAREMREIILEENARGATVFFSSHILEQVDAVCDRVGILQDGRLIAQDSIQGLRQSTETSANLTLFVSQVTQDALAAVQNCPGVFEVQGHDHEIAVTIADGSKIAVIDAVREAGVEIHDIATEESSLDDLFAAFTNRQEVYA